MPLGGGPTSIGGTTLGPIFCWVLWAIRHCIGPWTHNFPHAGGIGLSILQSAADAFLVVAIWRRFHSLLLALAFTLFVATEPYDMALTATIWNPPLAVAFAKLAMAFVLLGGPDGSIWWSVGATTASTLAVQTHSSALFFALPVITSITIRELLAHRWTRALQVAMATSAAVLLLEVPIFVDMAMHPVREIRPVAVVGSVSYTLAHPTALRPLSALRALVTACDFILMRPWTFEWMGPLLAVCALVTTFRVRRDAMLAGVTVGPLAAAVFGFAFWQAAYEHYWFLVIAPSAALTIVLALTAWPSMRPFIAAAMLLVVVWAQPWRTIDGRTMVRLPEYGALATGSLALRRHATELRHLDVEFPLPPSAVPEFLYETLGGRIDDNALFSATIRRTGEVIFTPVPSMAQSGPTN